MLRPPHQPAHRLSYPTPTGDTTMRPESTEQPTVRKMKSDRERDGKRNPRRKQRDLARRAQRATKRAHQGR